MGSIFALKGLTRVDVAALSVAVVRVDRGQ